MDAVLELGGQIDLSLSVDHGQFAVVDRDAIIDVDAYTDEAVAARLAQFDGGIVVFTDSAWTTSTPLRVRLTERRPDVDVAAYDLVVSGGVACATGELRIFSPEETGINERSLAVPAGGYGVMACGAGFGQTNEHGDDGADRYELWLWPTNDLPKPESLTPGRSAE
jgi:hypothetical protein